MEFIPVAEIISVAASHVVTIAKPDVIAIETSVAAAPDPPPTDPGIASAIVGRSVTAVIRWIAAVIRIARWIAVVSWVSKDGPGYANADSDYNPCTRRSCTSRQRPSGHDSHGYGGNREF